MTFGEKNIFIQDHVIYPMYSFIQKKQTILKLQNEFKPNFSKELTSKKISVQEDLRNNLTSTMKSLSINPNTEDRYKLIKGILKYFDQSGYLGDNFKGIFFHTMKSNDILFIHHPEIKEKDRIIYINLDDFVKKLEYAC